MGKYPRFVEELGHNDAIMKHLHGNPDRPYLNQAALDSSNHGGLLDLSYSTNFRVSCRQFHRCGLSNARRDWLHYRNRELERTYLKTWSDEADDVPQPIISLEERVMAT